MEGVRVKKNSSLVRVIHINLPLVHFRHRQLIHLFGCICLLESSEKTPLRKYKNVERILRVKTIKNINDL